MSAVASTTSTSSLFANSVANSATSQKGSQTLNENDFLKLLTQQLQNQDPLQPQDNTAMIAQMAQFSTLQQQNTMTQQISNMSANDIIGKTVTVNPGNGAAYVSGLVQGVDTSGATPQIYINGAEYPLSEVQLVQPAAVATSAATAAAAAASSSSSSNTSTATTS